MRKITIFWLLIISIFTLTGLITLALQPAFPTLDALGQHPVPAADRYDLAARFWNVREVPPPLPSPVDWQVGDEKMFFVSATDTRAVQEIPARLLAMGEHVLVWGDTALQIDAADAQRFALSFDTEVYDSVTEFWGFEPPAGIDGDARVLVLFTDAVRNGVAGYFSAQNTYPRLISPASNEHEMITLHHAAVGGPATSQALSVSAHEFQHLLRHQQDANEFIWMDEGFSGLTQYALGFDTLTVWARPFAIRPHTQLNAWGTGDNRAAEYGAAFLFMLYFQERYGLDGLRLLSEQDADGLAAVDATLAALDGSGADAFFADWVLANVLRTAPPYGYFDAPQMPAVVPRTVSALPYRYATEERPYSTEYYEIALTDQPLTITLDLPEAIPLIEFAPASGQWMWYSLRGDDSNPRLTRAFDLREVASAELQYRIWYDLEEGWDYGYVSISADGGMTWDVQRTPHMTGDDPHRRAYAPGYTGQSLFWREETLSLDAYAGRVVSVRFEVVTDDAINQPGMALDDVRIEAIGYTADFEAGDGGWISEGWVHTDNRLPPRAWVQAVQVVDGAPRVTRWLAEGDRTFTLAPLPGAERTLLAISPLAPLTTAEVAYTLGIE